MNKYKFKLLTSTGLGCEYFYCYGDEHFEQWLKRKNIKYEIDKKSINRFNKQKEVLDKIKDIYENSNKMEYKKERFMQDLTLADQMYKSLEEIE
ncbi:MAG: hypothetical protein IKJ30_00365 [Bacilli bacterium]|nr:hypothetical protein [Bacilli bacterium]